MSAREFEKAGLGNKSEFEKLKTSADTKSGKTTIQNGDVTTTVTKNDDGSFSRVTHNSKKGITVASNYDANGRVVSQNIKTSSGSVSTAYNYDKAGNLIGTEQVKKMKNLRLLSVQKSLFLMMNMVIKLVQREMFMPQMEN